ncbi:MAG TPA: SDR family oxidoreductase [Dongiaceae bacterium]|nr:SDR family oxidoreductase [Dongiaceae bacterium]
MSAERILVTGADGYIGKLICDRLLANTNAQLVLWVRSNDADEFDRKRALLEQKYAAQWERIELHTGNLYAEAPFATVNPQTLDRIIHAAAVTAFNVKEDVANAVNRDGTRKLLVFARGCTQLRRFCYVSTAYAAGLAAGAVIEQPLPPTGPFANHYERSKCEAEAILLNEYGDLPWHIYRVATVISHNDAGDVSQYNVFHNTMRLLFYGLISMLPGTEETPIYLVTGEWVADAIAELSVKAVPERQFFHVCHRQEESLPIGRLVDLCFEVFGNDEAFRKRRILRPLFTDFESFELLAEGLSGLSGQVVSQAVESIRPFAPQMFVTKQFNNDQLRVALDRYRAPDPETLVRNTVRYLVQTKWGREV